MEMKLKPKHFSSSALTNGDVIAALRAMRNTDVRENREHLRLAGEWILTAQATGEGGYAHSYSLLRGWERSYPETTGYIIPTMLRLGDYLQEERYTISSVRAGEWLLSVQRPDGAFPDLKGQPQVFDTGQIIEGLLEIFRKTGNEGFLSSASRAGDFLIRHQDDDGKWTTHSYQRQPHTYYTRVAANLLRLHAATGEQRYKDAAEKQLHWTLTQQHENGFFGNMAFNDSELPFLHTIVYVLEGLLTGYELTGADHIFGSLKKSVDRLININKTQDFILYSQYDEHWKPYRREKCLTGLAQWSGLILDLFKITGEKEYYRQAVKTLYYLKAKQIQRGSTNIRGALPGSIPLWGRYFPFAVNNWTVKFFIDALLRLGEYHQGPWDEQEIYVGESFSFNSGKFFDPKTAYTHSPYTPIFESVIHAIPHGGVFLDIGCGEGHMIRQLSSSHPDIRFVGVDPTFAMPTTVTAANIQLSKGTAYHLPLADASADCILVKEVLQHIAFPRIAFREILRIAKPGASLIIVERNPFSVLGLLKVPFELFGKWMYPWDAPFRERWYGQRSWRTMLRDIGIVESTYTVNMNMSRHSAFRWMLKYVDRFYVFVLRVK